MAKIRKNNYLHQDAYKSAQNVINYNDIELAYVAYSGAAQVPHLQALQKR